MVLINRIARIFRADLHAVLDRIEEPAELLRQAVREMQEELAGAERELAARRRAQRALEQRREELGRALAELERELDLCCAAGKHDLARGLVRRKLEARRQLAHVEARIEDGARGLAEHEERLAHDRALFESVQRQAAIHGDRAPASADPASGPAQRFAVSEEEIDVALLAELKARDAS